jgi:hypothetical protein
MKIKLLRNLTPFRQHVLLLYYEGYVSAELHQLVVSSQLAMQRELEGKKGR